MRSPKRRLIGATVEERLWHRVEKTDTCWTWTATTNNKGYGMIGVGPARNCRRFLVHRLSYEFAYGPIPDGLCVRPDHLFLGTQLDNIRDAARKGRLRNGNADKTHCPRGHVLTPRRKHPEWRQCITCRRMQARERYERRAAR